MKPKLIIFLLAVFLLAGFGVSVIAGFSLGQVHGVAVGRHARDHAHVLEKVAFALNLSSEQRAQVEPAIVDAGPRISAIEADAQKKKYAVIDSTLSRIRPLLTVDQQKKLDELQKARDDLHSAKDRVRALTGE